MENPTQPHSSLSLSLFLFSVEVPLFSLNNGFLYFGDSHASHLASHLGSRSGSRIRTSLITNQVYISDFFSTFSCSRCHLKATDSLFGSNSIRHSSVAFLRSVNLASGSSPSNAPTGTPSHRRQHTPLSSPSLSRSLPLPPPPHAGLPMVPLVWMVRKFIQKNTCRLSRCFSASSSFSVFFFGVCYLLGAWCLGGE